MLMNFALGSKGIVFFEWEGFVWPRSTMVVYRKPMALELEILLGESKAKCAGGSVSCVQKEEMTTTINYKSLLLFS